MKTKSEISGYIARSAVIVVVLSSAIIGFAPAFYLSGTDPRLSWYSAKLVKVAPQTKTLTFTERVAYQQAIEEVYWHHRIWPMERPDPKPSLDAVISQVQLENKVADYLGKFQAVEDYWQRPLSVEQLQAEINRMAQHTREPEVL